jgi:predicted nucleotidyltransferase
MSDNAFQDYRDILELFNEYQVEYLVVGAYAMGNFGYTRHTHDIDLWVRKSEENAVRISRALEEFGVPFSIEPDDFMEEGSVIQIGLAPYRIDILTDIDGVAFDTAWQNKTEGVILGVPTSIISLKDLIRNKSSTDRPKDRLDRIQLEELHRMKNDDD